MTATRNNNKKVLFGSEGLIIFIMVLGAIYLINVIFELRGQVRNFNQLAFNTKVAENSYSVSLTNLSLIVKSKITSVPNPNQTYFEDFPFLTTPLTYRVTHYISPFTNHAEVSVLLNENPTLAETIQEDIEGSFLVVSEKQINFEIKRIHYKNLVREFIFTGINGFLRFGENTETHIKEFEGQLPRLKFFSNDLKIGFASGLTNFKFRADSLNVNDKTLNDVKGIVTQTKGTKISALYNFIPTTLTLSKEGNVHKGKFEIPVKLVDALIDPVIENEFEEKMKMFRTGSDLKGRAVFSLSLQPKKEARKREILATYVPPENIKRIGDFYTFSIGIQANKGHENLLENKEWMKEIIHAYQSGQAESLIVRLKDLKFRFPDRHEPYFGLGWVYGMQHDEAKSLEHYSVSCSLGYANACIIAGDHFNYKNGDLDRSSIMYQLACDKNLGNGCLKAGISAKEKGSPDNATQFLLKSCVTLKDFDGCYHLARHLNDLDRPKKEVASYLYMACNKIKPACRLASNLKNGKKIIIPKNY